jgi:hypothetical protein
MLSYWHCTLVASEDSDAFIKTIKLNTKQEFMFETVARPLGKGSIELGRSLTMIKTTAYCLRFKREYDETKKNAMRAGKKKGDKKNRQRG